MSCFLMAPSHYWIHTYTHTHIYIYIYMYALNNKMYCVELKVHPGDWKYVCGIFFGCHSINIVNNLSVAPMVWRGEAVTSHYQIWVTRLGYAVNEWSVTKISPAKYQPYCSGPRVLKASCVKISWHDATGLVVWLGNCMTRSIPWVGLPMLLCSNVSIT